MGFTSSLVVAVIASTLSTTIAYPYSPPLSAGKTNQIFQKEHTQEHVQKPDKAPEYSIMDFGKKGKHHRMPAHEEKVMPDMEFEPHMPTLDLDKFTQPKPEDYHQHEHEHQEQEMKHDDHLADIIAQDHHHQHEEHPQHHHEDSHQEYHQPDIHHQDVEKDEPEMHNHEMLDYVLWATIPPYFPKGKLEWFKHYPTFQWIGDSKHCTEQPPPSSPPRFQLLPYHFHLTKPVSPNDKTVTMAPIKGKQPIPHPPETKNHMPIKIFVPTKTAMKPTTTTTTTTTTTKSPTKSMPIKHQQQHEVKGAKKAQPLIHHQQQQQHVELPVQQQEQHHSTKGQQKEERHPTKTQQKEEHHPTKTQQKEEQHTPKMEEKHPTKGQQKEQPHMPPTKVSQQKEEEHPPKETQQHKEEEQQHQDIQRHPTKGGQKGEHHQGTKSQQKEEHPTKTVQHQEKPQVQVMVQEQKEEPHSGTTQQMEDHNPSKTSDQSIKGQEKEDRKEEPATKGEEHEVEQFDVQKLEKPSAHEEKPQQGQQQQQQHQEAPTKGKQEEEHSKPTKQPVKVIETNKANQEEQHQQVQIPSQEPESLYSEGNGRQLMGNSDHPFGQRQQSGRLANPPVNHNVRESFLSAAEQARHLSRTLSSSNGHAADSTAARSSRTNSAPVRSPTMRSSQSEPSETTPMQRVYLGQGSIERHEANGRTQVRLSCNLGPETARISKIEWVRFVGDYEMDSSSGVPPFECQAQTCRMEQVKSDPLVTVHSNMVPQSSSGQQGLSQAALTIHQVEDEHQAVYRCSGIRETAGSNKRELVYRLIAV